MTSWADLPIGRVVCLDGSSPEAFRMAAAQIPSSGPAVLTCDLATIGSVADVVTAVLEALVSIAVDLLPRWLPDAIDGPAEARAAALRRAAESDHFGPYLADLAEFAMAPMTGRPPSRFPAEIRAAGLARVLTDTFDRRPVGLLVTGPDSLEPTAAACLVAAAEWLCSRSGFGIWLAGPALTSVERIAVVRLDLPGELVNLVDQESHSQPLVWMTYPPTAGSPSPGSVAEHSLEVALSTRSWATGRTWNQGYRLPPPGGLIRPDLHWPDESCVVEIDGPEHRGPLQYACDRRRDVLLQLDGQAVLRFTNAQILYDLEIVLSQIERYLRSRRTSFPGGITSCLKVPN